MNVKAGDIAILIKTHRGECVGAIVEVVKFRGDVMNPIVGLLKDAWVIKSTRPLLQIDGRKVSLSLHPDAWLRPVSGIPDTDSIPAIKELGAQ